MSAYSSSHSVQAAPGGVAVLVVTYEPGCLLLDMVEALVRAGAPAIIVVDDGTSPARQWVLNKVALEPTVHLLRHSAPQGRGAALKTGMQYFLDHLRHYAGLVTFAADGQYSTEDVLRVARALHRSPTLAILGAREFGASDLLSTHRSASRPLSDRLLGLVFRVLTGIALADVQSRLRALPTGLLPRLLRIPGSRYDYELAMLLHIARSGYPLAEHAIPGRLEMHSADPGFRPVADSLSFLRAMLNYTPADSFAREHRAAEPSGPATADSPGMSRPGARQTR
jgi:glycosyltransferase involved in cell wall biosynthesis